MAYDPTKPISQTNNPESISGNVATTPSGAQVDTITGALLAPATNNNFLNPEPTVPSGASTLPDFTTAAAEAPIQQETDISSLIKQITEGNTALTGQEAYRSSQEQAQGVQNLMTQQDDLNAQLQMLKAAEKNVPLQIQQESVGRGRTEAGVRPLEIGRLRENAIQANIVGAQLAGIQGKISTANALVERAVQAKYGDLEIQQKAKIANLELLLKDPALTRAQEKRAQAQLKIQNAEAAKLAEEKKGFEAAQKATLEYRGIASTAQLAEMSKAKNALEVAQIASKYNLKTAAERQAEANLAKTIQESKSKLASLPPATQTRVQGIAGQFDAEQAVKNYQTSAEAIDAVKSTGITPTDDISRIYAFAKVMDPNSVVREGEYKTVQDYSTAVLQRYGLTAKRAFTNTGFLTEEARRFILNTLENRLASSRKAYDNIYSEYGRRINKVTGQTDGTDYITDYAQAFTGKANNDPLNIEIKPTETNPLGI